jgi:hypothetical protein
MHNRHMRLGAALVAAVLVLAAGGCTGLSGVARELKDDPAIVVVNVGSPWGQQKLVRIGGTTNAVSVSPDGTVSINPAAR